MATAVDTSVLLDVLLNDPRFAAASAGALRTSAGEGSVVICEVVIAEILPVLPAGSLAEFLADWNISFVPSTLASASLAGEMFLRYLGRGGKRGRVVPDFLIAAHAEIHAGRLLARDRGYYRDYFSQLTIIEPGQGS